MDRRLAIALAIALVFAGFGAGAVTMRWVDSHHASGSAATVAEAEHGLPWPLFGHPRAADAPRPPTPRPDGFAFWRSRIDTSRPDPVGCAELTRPLDPTRSYADYVLVTPDLGHKPAVSVNPANPAELCVGGMGLADHQVTLLRGLPARTGETLAANAQVDFSLTDKPPYVGFAGQGVILPRDESDGVAIETLNVTKLAVEVWRVPSRDLPRKSISAPDPTAEGDYPGDWGDDSPDDEGVVVWKGEVAVAGPVGQRQVTVFPLGAVLKEMKPGAYVIKARDASGGRDIKTESGELADPTPPAQARRWIVFTDMALTGYQGSDGLDVVVRSLKSAKVLPGLKVALVAHNGEDLGVATTDGSGRVRFPGPMLKGEGGAAARMVMAYGQVGDLAVLDLNATPIDLSNQQAGARAPGADAAKPTAGREIKADVDAYLYADRGIYRPGETVHLVAMVRDREARAVKDRKGDLIIRRPSGLEFARLAFDHADIGAVLRDVALPRSAPRGHWTAQLKIDGIDDPVGQLSFAVEDFAPQRLAVTLAAQPQAALSAGEIRRVPVSARFLYGAPGAGLQTQGELRLTADPDPFPQYKDYRWGDDKDPFDEKQVDLPATVTDGAGAAVLPVDASQAGSTTVPLVAALTASVFEPGGRPVRETAHLKVRTQPVYFGVKVDQSSSGGADATPVSLDVIAVDPQGRRATAVGTEWTLISENWNYDWFEQDGHWQWRRTSREAVVARGTLDIAAGGSFHLNRRLGWGDYRIEVASPTGARTVIRFAAGWGAPASEAEAPDLVRVSAGTRAWRQGDTVQVAIQAPYAGEAQVAVATDRLIDFKTLSVGRGQATVSLKTSAAWGGGAYVLVSVIQPRDPSTTPKPRRALGLVYVPLDPGGRKLSVDIGTPPKIDSKAAVDVPITVHGLKFGQRAHVTLAAVDEGILLLTKQASPDPAAWYFGKRALSLDYRDDYGRLLDPNMGAPAQVNFGGDELGGIESLTTTPIKTVALWSGEVDTGPDGRAVIKLPAADFNGELRLMAVAWTDDAVGSASKPLTVRQPVVADLDLPRFLSPGDHALATLELHNLEGRAGAYVAQIFAQGGVLAPFRKLYALLVGQRVADHADLTAPGRTGVSTVGFRVDGPGFTTVKSYPIETRLGWGPITRTDLALQRPGEPYTPPASLLSGLAAGSVTLQVSYSPFKGFDPAAVALSLNRYPYGCTEQLVSIAYPLLYAAEATSDPRLRRSSAALNDAVGRLLDREGDDGAFGLWRVGDGEADAWLGAYATDFLVEAKAQGAPVPDSAMDRALGAMRRISRPDSSPSVGYVTEYPKTWAGSEDASKDATARLRSRASAYALYVLAKGGRGDLASLRWWHDVQMKTETSPVAKAQVAAGLAMMGDRTRAHDSLMQAVRALGYRDQADWYQSPLRDLAAVIAYAYEAGEPGVAHSLEGRLEGAVRDPDDLNTQEQARLMQAAHQMLKAAGPIQVQVTGAGAMSTAAGAPRWSVGRLEAARFVNVGRGPLWRTVTVRGTPLASPAALSQGVSVETSYWTVQGAPVDLARLSQGARVVVRIAGVSRQGRSTALVLDDPLPAGFEIETALGPDDARGDGQPGSSNGPYSFLGQLDAPLAQESRDDRYVAALTVEGGKSFAVAYVARAVTAGDFYLPGAEARDMYRPQIYARSGGGRTRIALAGP